MDLPRNEKLPRQKRSNFLAISRGGVGVVHFPERFSGRLDGFLFVEKNKKKRDFTFFFRLAPSLAYVPITRESLGDLANE